LAKADTPRIHTTRGDEDEAELRAGQFLEKEPEKGIF